MSNILKDKKQELMREYEEKNPGYDERKKLIFYLLAIFVGVRVINFILQAALYSVNNIPLEGMSLTALILSVIIAWCFSFSIYAGIKGFAYLALVGGVVSFYQAYKDNLFNYLTTDNVFFNVVNIVFLIAILIQIIIMGFLSIDKKSNEYFIGSASIQREMSAWAKSNQK